MPRSFVGIFAANCVGWVLAEQVCLIIVFLFIFWFDGTPLYIAVRYVSTSIYPPPPKTGPRMSLSLVSSKNLDDYRDRDMCTYPFSIRTMLGGFP